MSIDPAACKASSSSAVSAATYSKRKPVFSATVFSRSTEMPLIWPSSSYWYGGWSLSTPTRTGAAFPTYSSSTSVSANEDDVTEK